MIRRIFSIKLILVFVSLIGALAWAQEDISNDYFNLRFNSAGITSLKRPQDAYDTDYIREGGTLGDIVIRYRMLNGEWEEVATAKITEERRSVRTSKKNVPPEYLIMYDAPSGWYDYDAVLEISVRFRLEGDALFWTFHFRNLVDKPVEIGDIVLPLPFNTRKGWNKEESYTKRLIRHSFISGHGSFIFWMRPNSVGPYLVMIPVGECPLFEAEGWHRERNFKPAKLEYSDRQGVYMHSAVTGTVMGERGGNWRQAHTSTMLMPKFTPDDGVTYGYKFRWADDYDGVREVLYEERLFDVNVVPGMTVPQDLEAMVSLRTKNKIKSIMPEYPEKTQIEYLGEKAKDTHVYKVKFSRLGENLLTVNWSEDRKMVLEFFVTEPLETLIKKRAAFLVNKHQHREPSKWYNGLFSEWDMKNKVLRSPEDRDGLKHYVLSCDDPGLCKAPYIAAKNACFPSQKEVEAVEYYIENFLWGGLQCTEEEKHPYGIFGIPNWKVNRESKPTDRRGWTEHLWRVFDYPHVIALYLNMYRVAKYYPGMTKYLDENGYLKRAFGTAKAFFTVPYKTARWSAHELGNYDELVIIDLIEELYAKGKKKQADWLKTEWEKKVAYFINEDPNLFHSEYSFDPTGFESYQAFARYALEELKKPDSSLKVKYKDAVRFMEEEIAGNIATRGWLGTAYYLLGGSGALRYTSQMGGWAILDYGLYYATNPYNYLRLGYASYLSSWALMNTGTPKSNYGYWYPGKDNDGGAGSAFVMQPFGRSWLGKEQARGAWFYSCEIDLGYGGALRTSATIVTDDPLFGLFAYGGQLTKTGRTIDVIPKDGLRKRFHVIRGKQRFHLLLDRDGYAKDKPIVFNNSLSEIRFTLENRGGGKYATPLKISGLPAGTYGVSLDGLSISTFTVESGKENVVLLPREEKGENVVVIRRIKG